MVPPCAGSEEKSAGVCERGRGGRPVVRIWIFQSWPFALQRGGSGVDAHGTVLPAKIDEDEVLLHFQVLLEKA